MTPAAWLRLCIEVCHKSRPQTSHRWYGLCSEAIPEEIQNYVYDIAFYRWVRWYIPSFVGLPNAYRIRVGLISLMHYLLHEEWVDSTNKYKIKKYIWKISYMDTALSFKNANVIKIICYIIANNLVWYSKFIDYW